MGGRRLPGDPALHTLTVRLLMPSEKAPICLAVTSESSICQRDERPWLHRVLKGKEAGAGPHLVQVILVHVDPPSLKGAVLGRLHIHGADVVLAVVLPLPPQTAEAAE